MPRYLTSEWLDAAQAAVASDPSLAAAAENVVITVQHIVTGGPDGEAQYHIAVDDGTVRVVPGAAAEPTITFVQDWETATAIARGDLSAQGAFMTGRIRLRGDLSKLVEFGNVFGSVDDVFGTLRNQTTY